MISCHKCGCLIEFIKTKKGSWLPVNPVKIYKDNVKNVTDMVVDIYTEEGDIIHNNDIPGYIPHYATCDFNK